MGGPACRSAGAGRGGDAICSLPRSPDGFACVPGAGRMSRDCGHCWGIRPIARFALHGVAWPESLPGLGVHYAGDVRWGWVWFLDPPFRLRSTLVDFLSLRCDAPGNRASKCPVTFDRTAHASMWKASNKTRHRWRCSKIENGANANEP
ncbi:hypothetical protein PVAP13_9NG186873 [Panicum virgatum]|uniref:Uncharacterized protein n=1 Tax=Panicum virgatum TaxID=38727 RepID=A0A8T0MM55_PANVG|nr:hypothetical protein PVAP13_9NG186873 [Panicum virgatum]